MGISAASGATIAITSTTTAPATFDAAGYAALSYTTVNSVESIGSFGDESQDVTFDDLGDRRTKHLKGQKDAGTLALVCGLDDTDAGQDLLRTAEADGSTGNFHFKVTLPNKQATAGDDAIRYFSGKVMSVRETVDSANNIVKLETNIGINTKIVYVDSTAV